MKWVHMRVRSILRKRDKRALAPIAVTLSSPVYALLHRELDARTMAISRQIHMTRGMDDKYVQMVYEQPAAEVHARLEKENQTLEKLVTIREQIYANKDSASIIAYEEAASAVGSFKALQELE